jgi:hypothetical protein
MSEEGVHMSEDVGVDTDEQLGEDRESPAPEYQLELMGEGLSFRRSVPQAVALQILETVMSDGGGLRPLVPPASTPRPGGIEGSEGHAGPSLTVGEFISEVGATRNPDKITAVAAYLTRERGQERFSSVEVKAEFPHAGEAVPANFSRDFKWAVDNKWIAADPNAGKDQYFITKTGLSAVEAGFSVEVRKTTRQKAPRRRAARKKVDGEE